MKICYVTGWGLILCALWLGSPTIDAQIVPTLSQSINVQETHGRHIRARSIQTDPTCNYLAFIGRSLDNAFSDQIYIYKKVSSKFQLIGQFGSGGISYNIVNLALSNEAKSVVFELRPRENAVPRVEVLKKVGTGLDEDWEFVSRFEIDNVLGDGFIPAQELGEISSDGKYISIIESNRNNTTQPVLYHIGVRKGNVYEFEKTFEGRRESFSFSNSYTTTFFDDQVAIPTYNGFQKNFLFYNLNSGQLDLELMNYSRDINQGLSFSNDRILLREYNNGDEMGMSIFQKNGLSWNKVYQSDFTPSDAFYNNGSIFYSLPDESNPNSFVKESFILKESPTGWTELTNLKPLGKSRFSPLDICDDVFINTAFNSFEDNLIEIYQFEPELDEIQVYDANPDYIRTGFFGQGMVDHITDLKEPENLIDASKISRNGIAADGVSEALLILPSDQKVVIADWNIDTEFGRFKFPWLESTREVDDQHYFFIHYFPPDIFPEDLPKFKIDGVDAVKVPFTVTTITEQGDEVINLELTLVRPPVVLVHGTFDNPNACWRTPISPAANTMVQGLEQQGFKVFTVDYMESNGQSDGILGAFLSEDLEASSFESNKQMVYENAGGIGDALDYYRDDMNVAVTQVDIVGHSMGGVLPRVYYSDGYETDYRRINNFMEGDINRHVSIASTHHGSEIVDILEHVEDVTSVFKIPLFDVLTSKTTVAAAWTFGGKGNFGAVADQKPQSSALQKIGQTAVPAHAILCSFPDQIDAISNAGEAEDELTYANIMRGLTFVFYFNNATTREWISTLIDRYNRLPNDLQNHKSEGAKFSSLPNSKVKEARKPSMREAFIDMFEFQLDRIWFALHFLLDDIDTDWISDSREIYVTPYETTEIGFNDPDDDLQVQIANGEWEVIEGERRLFGESADQSEIDEIVDLYRSLIFKNDLNDGVVRLESQKGGLSDQYTSHFNDILHTYAPRYPEIINRVSILLKSGFEHFDRSGFGPAGQLQPINIPDPTEVSLNKSLPQNPELEGLDAICWSGYVCSHALEYARFADKANAVILGRPVNPDATAVLFDDNAAKGMNIKGKSSNWGPQRALIAEDQKYSKIWFQYEADNTKERDEQIAKYNGEVVKSLNDPGGIAVLRQLKKKYTCNNGTVGEYDVFVDTIESDATRSIYFMSDQNQYFSWDKEADDLCKDKIDCCPIIAANPIVSRLKPLNVLADPRSINDVGDPLFYTADYDLLAIGFHDSRLDGWEEDDYPANVPNFTPEDFNPEKGFITERQDIFVDLLNEEVIERSQFKGGNLTHHGPENQYYIAGKPSKGSPYVDYPIIAFEPDSDRRGEYKGNIRAIPMGPVGFRDRYLKQYMAKMRRKGYDLYPNIVTNGWMWDYHHPYSYQLGWDDRDWPLLPSYVEELPLPDDCICQMKSNEKDNFIIDQKSILEKQQDKPIVYPNPAVTTMITTLKTELIGPAEYNIIDMSGRSILKQEFQLISGENQFKIDISSIQSGLYLLKVDLPNGSHKTVKFLKETYN